MSETGSAPLAVVTGRVSHLLALGRPDEALAALRPVLAQHPDEADLLCLAAQAHLVRDDDEVALGLAGRAAALDPDGEWPHRLRSIALRALGRPQEAAEAAYRCVQLRPFHYLPHLQYARCLAMLPGGLEQAWAEGNRAVQLAPQEPEVHLLMAQLAHPTTGTGPDGLRVAEAALRRTLELDPTNAAALNDLARIQLRRRRSLRAIAGFSDALTADPHNEVALHNVAVVLTGWLRPAHWITLAALYVSLLLFGAPGETVVRAAVALVVLLVLAAVLLRLRRAVPGRVVTFLRSLPRFSRWATAWGVAIGAAVACLVLAVVPALSPAAVGLGLLAIHLGLVCNWVWVIRSRRP